MMTAAFKPRPKPSIFDSAQHHMHAAEKYAKLASSTRDRDRAVGFTRRVTAHRKAATLIFAFVDSKRVSK